MFKKKPAVFLCFLVFLFSCVVCYGQQDRDDLKDKLITIKMDKQPLGIVFRYLMQSYDIPIGLEVSVSDRGQHDLEFQTNMPVISKHIQQSRDGGLRLETTTQRSFSSKLHPISLNFENEKLDSVFDQIVLQMGDYKWEIHDGVVNVIPTKERDERLEKLLDLHIAKFEFQKGQTVEDITKGILAMSEIRAFLSANDLVCWGVRTGEFDFAVKDQYGRAIDEEMSFANLSLRELLNKVTKIKKGGWIVKWLYFAPSNGKEAIDIDI